MNAGEVVGLLGPNGAGKTTVISMLLGVLEPTSGSIQILNQDPNINTDIKALINFASINAKIPDNLTVWQNLYVFGLLYNTPHLKQRIEFLLKDLEVEKFRNKRVGLLSSGEHTRVSLAKASLNAPKLLLLDEPTSSLDPSSALFIRDKIKEMAMRDNTAILWTSHNMHEVEAVCDRVLFLSKGKILLEGDPKKLPRKYQKKNLEELFISIAREPLILGFE